jgi:hypothetical protein
VDIVGKILRSLALRHTGRAQEAATKADRPRGQRTPVNISVECARPEGSSRCEISTVDTL